MKTDSKQTYMFIGIALIVVAVILMVYSISLPRVYESGISDTVSVSAVDSQNVNADSGNSKTEPIVEYPLNINSATAEELMTIDGIGESRANAIIEYREVLGGYTSLEQIKQIKGFSDSYYEQLAQYLTVE